MTASRASRTAPVITVRRSFPSLPPATSAARHGADPARPPPLSATSGFIATPEVFPARVNVPS